MKRLLFTLALCTMLVACGTKVEVPPAHVGKILTKNGFAPETVPPSKFRLPPCFAYCDRLVILQTADVPFKESMKVFMPEDKLNLTVEIRGTFSIPTDDATVNALFDKVVAQETSGSISVIGAATIYQTYGQPPLRGVVRSEVAEHTIADILAQREAISGNVHVAITEKMKATKTPILISRFELADIQPPDVIITAQEDAKRREIDIQKAEADAQVQMVTAQRDLEVAKMQRAVDREKAEAIAEQNLIAAKSVTPELLAYRRLEVAESIYSKLAKSNNVIVIPADSDSFSRTADDAVLARLLGKEVKR